MRDRLYVFLTNTLGGCSGGAVYVRNKVEWLQKEGWSVEVYDSGGQTRDEVLFKELKPFDKNHIYELYYHPSLFTRTRRETVINKISRCSCEASTIVIESNTIILAEWGEIIASKVKAKHLVYLIQENLVIQSENQYVFMKYKADYNELFSINPQAYKLLFSRFGEVSSPEDHYWQAGNASPIIDMASKIDSLPPADITISHFGRKKDYFNYMVREVSKFANVYPNKKIHLLLLGIEYFSNKEFDLSDNLLVFPLGSINPVPSSFYEVSDVIIATAGCASMSFRYGARVISMDTSNDIPLGILGWTTLDRTYRSSDNNNVKSLSELLKEVVVDKRFEGKAPMTIPATGRTYDYQIKFAKEEPSPYYDSLTVGTISSLGDFRDSIILKLGLVKFRTYLRYWAFRNSK